MSCTTIEDSRFTIKYSTISGQEPTIPLSDDHSDGTWLPTDIYIGEFFMNSSDDKLWIRTDNGIVPLGGTSGSTYSFIGDYVHISGGTYSGTVYAPTFSANGITASYIISDLFEGNFNGTFTGDGSGLTGINANWLGGTVSNPVFFTNEVTLDNTTYINGPITTTNSCVEFDTSICVTGGVSASYFIGDGSGLTNIPLGTYSDVYTTDAELSGNSIIFTRNDSFTYDVDLTPILASQSVAFINWNDITNTISITLTDGQVISETIDTFTGITSLGPINGIDFYGGNFYGTFVGTYSNDIYTTGATLSGTELIFDRTDGASYSVDLSPIVGGATPSLIDVLKTGNTPGTYSISSTDGETKIYFPPVPYDQGLYIDSTDPGDYIAQLQVKKLNGVVTAHTDLNTGAGSSIDISSPNGVITSSSDGAYITQIQHTGLIINVSSDSPTFAGIQYGSDYSTNYTNRSLVDKEYVDNAIAGAGATPSLSEVLTQGNETGVHDIILTNFPFTSTSDSIRALGNVLADSKFSFEDLGGGAWAPTMRVDDGSNQNYITVQNQTYIHNSETDAFNNRYGQITVSPTQLTTRVEDLASGEGTYTDMTSLYYKIGSANPIFAGAEYVADYSANFSSNSLVTKGWVESQLTLGLIETVGFRTDTISVDADSGMFSGITSVVPIAGITGSVQVAEDRVLLESIDDYRSRIDMTSEQIVIIGGGDLDNSKYRSEVHQLGTKKVTYYDETIASLGYGSAEKLQTFENSEHFYFDASSTGTMDLFYDYFFVGAVMDYEYEFFIRSQSASGKLMTYKIKKNGYYDGGNTFYPILPLETQKGTDDPFANGDWDIVITPTIIGDKYQFQWNFTDGYIYTISVYKKYKQKKY